LNWYWFDVLGFFFCFFLTEQDRIDYRVKVLKKNQFKVYLLGSAFFLLTAL
jgi:hypothetical protein